MVEACYVGLGGNQGGVRATLAAASAALGALPGVVALRASGLWASEPVGPVRAQPTFLNGCVELRLGWPAPSPLALLAALLDVEARLGRDRAASVPQGPRPIDLDLLLWGALELDLRGPPALRLPHPRLALRAFALAPLVELAGPALVIPGAGRAGDLLSRALASPGQRVERVG